MIQAPVGPKLVNEFADVRVVQLLLNMAATENPNLLHLDPDGHFGPNTGDAITAFQSLVMKVQPTGSVAPGDATLAELASRIPPGVIPEKIHGWLVKAKPIDVQIYFPGLNIGKRYHLHVAGLNLGIVLRVLFGVGTPRALQDYLKVLLNSLLKLSSWIECFLLLPRTRTEALAFSPTTRSHLRFRAA